MICASILSNGNADTIADAIRSVLPLADCVLLVDTGITDDTIEIAREAAGGNLFVEILRWPNRFDEARNFCLRTVNRMGATWYLMLDSDETYHVADAPATRAIIAGRPLVDCWLIEHDGDYVKEKMIRVSSAARYSGRTHESLIGVEPAAKRTLPGVTVSGRPKSPEAFRAKLLRDASALEAETAESPHDSRWWYYLGQTREGLGQHAAAIEAYRRCWGLPGWSEQAAWACYRAAVCHAEARDYAAALATCCTGLARDARFPELAWLAGWLAYQLGRKPEAAAWARAALAITDSGVCESRIGFRFLPGWRERPRNLLTWLEGKS
jgi:tetratricopeptide (TPR) repeat protein